jgi:hypothetical protein
LSAADQDVILLYFRLQSHSDDRAWPTNVTHRGACATELTRHLLVMVEYTLRAAELCRNERDSASHLVPIIRRIHDHRPGSFPGYILSRFGYLPARRVEGCIRADRRFDHGRNCCARGAEHRCAHSAMRGTWKR